MIRNIFGKGPGKGKTKSMDYDRSLYEPAVRKSICTGEMTVGFVEIATGKFHDVRLVSNEAEVEEFRKQTGCEKLRVVY